MVQVFRSIFDPAFDWFDYILFQSQLKEERLKREKEVAGEVHCEFLDNLRQGALLFFRQKYLHREVYCYFKRF